MTKPDKIQYMNISEKNISKKNISENNISEMHMSETNISGVKHPLRFSFDYYVLLFFLVSLFGWLWEAAIYLVSEHKFVNRGVMVGPWLPIYGAGAVFLYLALRKLVLGKLAIGKYKRRLLSVFVISLTICSVLEYISGFFLEKMWGIKWWDYSDMFMNLDGRICLMSCLLFGIGGIFLIFFLIPIYTALYNKIPVKIRTGAAIVLLLLFVADAAYSADFPNMGRGITYRIK